MTRGKLKIIQLFRWYAAVCLALAGSPAHAQADPTPANTQGLSAKAFCKDSGTYCAPNRDRVFFTGLRIVGEPTLGEVISIGKNRLEPDNFIGRASLGLETNLYQGWWGLQAMYMSPFGATFDSQSPKRDELISTDGTVNVRSGVAIGMSFLDGAVAVGLSTLFLDRRDFKNSDFADTTEGQVYVNLQPVSGLRGLLKSAKPD